MAGERSYLPWDPEVDVTPHRVRAPTAPVPKEPLPSPRKPGLSFRQGARTRRGPHHEDTEGDWRKPGPGGERSPSRGFLVARAAPNHTQKISRPAPKKPPSQCVLCSSAPGSGPTGCPPHPSPRCLIVPASRPPAPNGFLRSCLFPSSCLRDARALRSCLSPEIRHRRAAGQGRRPPFLARAPLLFGIPRKKNKKQQELFQALRLRRKSSPIRRLKKAGRQPGARRSPPGSLVCPLCPLRGRGES